MSRLEYALSLPKAQKALAWAGGLLFPLVAGLAALKAGRAGAQGLDLWLPFTLRALQGLAFLWIFLGFGARVLVVEAGQLRVTSRLRKPFGLPRCELPIREAALEWIDGRLVLQLPGSGLPLTLAFAPQATATSAWLVAQGARPPVGG